MECGHLRHFDLALSWYWPLIWSNVIWPFDPYLILIDLIWSDAVLIMIPALPVLGMNPHSLWSLIAEFGLPAAASPGFVAKEARGRLWLMTWPWPDHVYFKKILATLLKSTRWVLSITTLHLSLSQGVKFFPATRLQSPVHFGLRIPIRMHQTPHFSKNGWASLLSPEFICYICWNHPPYQFWSTFEVS